MSSPAETDRHVVGSLVAANRVGVIASDEDGVMVEFGYAVPSMGMPRPQVQVALSVRCALQLRERLRMALTETQAAEHVRDHADDMARCLQALVEALDATGSMNDPEVAQATVAAREGMEAWMKASAEYWDAVA